jgi:uncharacterized protein (DUF2342 family)
MTNPPFGFGLPGASGEPDPNDPTQLQAFLAQLQQMLANPGSGPVNWDLAVQVAQSQLQEDPAVATPAVAEVVEAVRLADLWLEPHSALPSGIRAVEAWRRAGWSRRWPSGASCATRWPAGWCTRWATWSPNSCAASSAR